MATVYVILLTLHNLNRWLVLIFGLWALLQNVPGLNGSRPFTPAERRPVAAFMGSVHLQLVLGLLLSMAWGARSVYQQREQRYHHQIEGGLRAISLLQVRNVADWRRRGADAGATAARETPVPARESPERLPRSG